MSARIHLLPNSRCTIGENPLWDAEEDRLYWIDVAAGNIFCGTPDGREVRLWRFPWGTISSLALRASGGAIVTAANGIHLLDLDTGEIDTLFQVDSKPGVGFNDAKVDRQGRLVTGLVDGTQLQTAPGSSTLVEAAGLYRVDHDLEVRPLAEGFIASNGPSFSPDGTILYWNDSWALRTYAFDYDPETGVASNRRQFADFIDPTQPVQPMPDGSTVDEEGFLWTAALYAGEIRRYAPDGTLDRRISLPLMKPLGVAFGGPEMEVLYVTTMGDAGFPGDPLQTGVLDGSILALSGLGVRGIPERRFAG
ncbi:SMP-30/gluconolactonase/LRE family protein [Lentzea sp. NPDC051208]|uniref:SMP-30/gluconolactonase/LRE family protein n=1 Tax=Lentzea sp. NPDC051208 TaxID=3154642 RepID=UPI00341B87C5